LLFFLNIKEADRQWIMKPA